MERRQNHRIASLAANRGSTSTAPWSLTLRQTSTQIPHPLHIEVTMAGLLPSSMIA
jgi:hypothetical protein